MQLGSKQHFQEIFSKIDIDQDENPDLKIEQLKNEIDQLKHYHKLEIENYVEDFNSVNKELKKSRSIIDEFEEEIKETKKAYKLEYNNLLNFHKFEIDELRKKLDESDKHNQWLEEELEVLETGKTREELFG